MSFARLRLISPYIREGSGLKRAPSAEAEREGVGISPYIREGSGLKPHQPAIIFVGKIISPYIREGSGLKR